jgi:nitroimidazol reductase NimA-like FMN-containing flavoprotein (pyridoxamine 5'-phosphate oxidase superfamily)
MNADRSKERTSMKKKESSGNLRKGILSTTMTGSADVPAQLKWMDRKQRHAVLATSSARGPHVSLIAFVLTKDGRGIVFATPTATAKHRNMKKSSGVALLIDNRTNSGKDYAGAETVTVFGRAKEIKEGPRWAELATLLVSKHKELGPFVAAPTTALMLVTIRKCVHVGRFQEVTEWRAKGR